MKQFSPETGDSYVQQTLPLLVLCSAPLFFWISPTPAEVLKLKEAGVSEETIQMMLQNEAESRISSDQVEQGYATDHTGSWQLRDGRTIHSTGKRRLPLDYPTQYPTPPPYAPYADPHIILSPEAGAHGQPR